MARLNIEDSLFKDPRFTTLCIKLGSRATAIGALVDFWFEAQVWWKGKANPKTKEVIVPTKSGIPLPRYSSLCLVKEIIEVGLAKIENDAVFACGAEEQFSWILQKVEARSGKSKGQKNPEIELNGISEERGITGNNVQEAPTPPPPLSSYLSSLAAGNPNKQIWFEEFCFKNFGNTGMALKSPRVYRAFPTKEAFDQWNKQVAISSSKKGITDRDDAQRYFEVALDRELKSRGVA